MQRTNCVTGQGDTQYGVLRDATAARATYMQPTVLSRSLLVIKRLIL